MMTGEINESVEQFSVPLGIMLGDDDISWLDTYRSSLLYLAGDEAGNGDVYNAIEDSIIIGSLAVHSDSSVDEMESIISNRWSFYSVIFSRHLLESLKPKVIPPRVDLFMAASREIIKTNPASLKALKLRPYSTFKLIEKHAMLANIDRGL